MAEVSLQPDRHAAAGGRQADVTVAQLIRTGDQVLAALHAAGCVETLSVEGAAALILPFNGAMEKAICEYGVVGQPSAPEWVQGMEEDIKATTVTLSWSGGTGADAFELQARELDEALKECIRAAHDAGYGGAAEQTCSCTGSGKCTVGHSAGPPSRACDPGGHMHCGCAVWWARAVELCMQHGAGRLWC